MFPHVAGKFAGGALSPVTVAFFAKAGSQPPDLWVYVAATSETLVGVTLVLGICRPGAALLVVAVHAGGYGRMWSTGGYEYPVLSYAWRRRGREEGVRRVAPQASWLDR
jgi:putative oxidoreductase